MIEGLKPYPSMKPSGVAWLGEVPAHWNVRRLKQACMRIVGGSTPVSSVTEYWDGDVTWVTPADVSRHSRLATSLRRITEEGLRSCSAELVPPGSVVMTTRAPVGNVAFAEVELCTNQGCKALLPDPNVLESSFLFRMLGTRGLDPNIGLKPSGLEWYGDIPRHWEVKPLLRSCIERADYRGKTPTKTETGVFLITAKNIRRGWIDYETSKEYVSEDEYESIMRRGLPKSGDLLFTTEAPLGNFALVDREDVALAQRVIRFRLDPSCALPEFTLMSVLSPYFQDQLLRRATGSTALGIKASKLPQLLLLLPPLPEQRAIIEAVRETTAPQEASIGAALRGIGLLREYRARLIADVVTGKLDVREAATRLPVEVGGEDAEMLGAADDLAGEDIDDEVTEEEAA